MHPIVLLQCRTTTLFPGSLFIALERNSLTFRLSSPSIVGPANDATVNKQSSEAGWTPTAASSGLSAPFAMLCFHGRLAWTDLVGSLSCPSFCSSNSSHSSRVGMYPDSKEKNLCRKTVLIRSRARVEYQPVRSLRMVSTLMKRPGNGTHITDFKQVVFILYHFLQHRIVQIA